MTKAIWRGLLAAFLLYALCTLAVAAQTKPAGPNAARFGRFTIESKHLEGTIGGPWEFSKGVVVTSPDGTLTCDALKVWPAARGGGRDFDRAEATGNLVIRGRYLASDKTEWRIVGSASAGTYDGKAGQGVLRGAVKFTGANLTTKAVLSVAADKMTYQVKSRQFSFERAGEPVLVRWEQPQPPAPAAAPQAGGK